MLSRRWVLTGLVAAPAAVAANKLMPVRAAPAAPVDWKRSVDWRVLNDGTTNTFELVPSDEKLDSSWLPVHGYYEGDILHMTYYRKDSLWKSSV